MSKIIEHAGIVNHIEGTQVRVMITQQSACSGCHAKSACTASDMAEKYIDVESRETSFAVGEKVVLTGRQSMGMLAVLLAFVIPFLLILVSLYLLQFYISNEVYSGIISLGILVPYYGVLALFNNKMKSKFQFDIRKEQAE
ncbi:MAG TPA: SoxR reducing system RseC family protein [Paludibacter sp.]|nr:SoxR reducing system RseC family protein [Paludibacter sp.]